MQYDIICLRLLDHIANRYLNQIAVDSDLRFVHHQGLAKILEYCGPEYFQDLPVVFESTRFTMVSLWRTGMTSHADNW